MVFFKLKYNTLGRWQQHAIGHLVNVSPLFTIKGAVITTCISQGLHNEEIAQSLSGILKTIQPHRKRLCQKTGSKNGMAFGILQRLTLCEYFPHIVGDNQL